MKFYHLQYGQQSKALTLAKNKRLNLSNMLYDISVLHMYSNGDKEFEADMIQTFLDQAPDVLSEIEHHFNHNNATEVGKIAHKFKSSVALFGMDEIFNTLQLIENSCRDNNDSAIIADQYAELKILVKQVIPKIEEEKKLCLK